MWTTKQATKWASVIKDWHWLLSNFILSPIDDVILVWKCQHLDNGEPEGRPTWTGLCCGSALLCYMHEATDSVPGYRLIILIELYERKRDWEREIYCIVAYNLSWSRQADNELITLQSWNQLRLSITCICYCYDGCLRAHVGAGRGAEVTFMPFWGWWLEPGITQ